MAGIAVGLIGVVEDNSDLTIFGCNGKPVIGVEINQLKEAWQAPLKW